MTRRLRFAFHWLVAAVVALSPTVVLAVDWIEGTNGDLSGDANAPTSLGVLSIGGNTVSGSFNNVDYDIFTFTIAPDQQLTSINLNSTSLVSPRSFFTALQNGGIWNGPLGNDVDVEELMGWLHAGPEHVGQNNLLSEMSIAEFILPENQFTAPLSAGTYTMLLQETSKNTTSASITLNVVPEPSIWALLVAAASLNLFYFHRRYRIARARCAG